jgi:hypothetical protein
MTQDETFAALGGECSRALSLIRRMADRCDRSINGVCRLCMVGRPEGGWWFADDWSLIDAAPVCPNDKCMSHDIRSILLNAER